MLVEHLLQLLVGEVDAELLEVVRLEDLEPEDVHHPDLVALGRHLGRDEPAWRAGGQAGRKEDN